jgi:hypothetical protein
VSYFSQSIHNHPYSIISFLGARQSSNKIHTNLFPLPLGYLQWMQQSSWPLVFNLNSLTQIAHSHMCIHVSLQSIPPIFLLQILIHLGATRMIRIIRVMGLLQNSLTKAFNIRNTYPVLEPYGALRILCEFRTSTFSNQILNLLYFSITNLSFADFSCSKVSSTSIVTPSV